MISNVSKKFFLAMRAHRIARKITIDEMAERLNVNRVTIYNWEKGKVDIRLSHAVAIAQFLDFEIDLYAQNLPEPQPVFVEKSDALPHGNSI